MKVTFLLPYAGLAGGIRVVAIYASLLSEFGHDVHVISVSRQPLTIKTVLRRLIKGEGIHYPGKQKQGPSHLTMTDSFKWTILHHNGPIENSDVPNSDVVIATWWKTAEWLDKLNEEKGKKVYFCQGYEVNESSPRERVEATYQLPFLQICVSSWIRNKISELTQRNDQCVVMNGVDSSQFCSEPREKSTSTRFGFVYSAASIKGTDILLQALSLAKKMNPRISAVCFSARKPSQSLQIPEWIEFHYSPTQKQIRDIYAQCDAWLFGSRAEGFGLPILEAMACRTPVIATPAGAALDLVNDGNGFLVPHENPQAIVDRMVQISQMPKEQWKLLSDGARFTAEQHGWRQAASGFENILHKLVLE